MTKFAKALGGLLATLIIAGCGGGGGSGSDGGFTAPGLRVAITPTSTQLTPFSLTDVAVRVTTSNGTPVSDGTQVTLASSSTSLGLVSSLNRVGTGPVIGERIIVSTVGGSANFRFHSRAVGSVTLTASARDTASGSAQVTATSGITIVAGAPTDPRLVLVAQSLSLPVNRFGVSPFLGSPFLTEVTATWRRLNGELVTVVPQGRELVTSVSVNPVNAVGGFSMLDDPATEDDDSTPEIENNEFLTIMGQAPVDMVAGKATIFFHSFNEAGQAVMTATVQDPDTDETVQAQLTFNTVTGTPPLPGSIVFNRTGRALYSSESGGNTLDNLEVAVFDTSDTKIPDPVSGGVAYNNVRLEIVGGSVGGDRVRATNAQGQTVSGGSIAIRTTQGIAGAVFETGTRVGSVQLRATVDRADNNVDNNISDPLISTINVTIGDGRLFDLDITSPTDEDVQNLVFSDLNGASTGVYQFPITALATDRYGNPVLPGTEIRFGVIDSPQNSAGEFSLRGSDGDPQEGGTGFTAPTGAFRTAGGGAGPNDTVIVFGEESNGNRDLESARRVASVATNTSLTTATRFNYNDDTGATVNNGPVLPYIIGRAVDANIGTVAPTDQNGIASVLLTYPVGKLYKLTALYAQGTGDVVNGTNEIVTDAEYFRLPGKSPGVLVASPDPIAGNSTVTMSICLIDAAGNGVPGVRLQFTFEDLFGAGSVDGVANSGFLANLTGADGCVDATVVTSGIPPSDTTSQIIPKVRFFIEGTDNGEGDPIQDEVTIRVNTNWWLYASPAQIFGDGNHLIELKLVDSSGTPVPNVLIVGTCEGGDPGRLTFDREPGLTDANGKTTTIVQAFDFDQPDDTSATGECEFQSINGEAVATVLFGGRDLCDVAFSPEPPNGCDAASLTLTLNGTNGRVRDALPGGVIDCQSPGNCIGRFSTFTTVTLSASRSATWGGTCAACGTGTVCSVALGDVNSNTACTVTFP